MLDLRVFLALIGGGMVLGTTTVFLEFFPRDGDRPTRATATLIGFLLVASGAFWATLLGALVRPSLGSWVVAIVGSNAMTLTPLVWLGARWSRSGNDPVSARGWRWPTLLAASMTASEGFMGAVFVAAQQGAARLWPPEPVGPVVALSQALNSPWFFWGMLGVMVPLLFWVPFPPAERAVLLGFTATGGVGPFVVPDPIVGAVGMAVLMVATMVVIFGELGRRPAVAPTFLGTSLAVAGAFAVMDVGQLAAAVMRGPWGDFGFALACGGVMLGEMIWLVRRILSGFAPESPVLWISRPRSVTLLLGLTFLSEILMAAVLVDLTSGSPTAIRLAGAAAHGIGAFWAYPLAALVEIAGLTASPFFLLMMGTEMGALVLVRIRRTVDREQRVRLGLALGAFGLYTILGPLLVPSWADLPGTWPNLGAFGPASPLFAGAILGSYAILAGLVLMFGRRAYCSVLCTSATMYGGSFAQQMIPTLRTSPWPRHQVLGSRWRGVPRVLAVSSWSLFAAVTVVSFWDAIGHPLASRGFLPGGLDPSVLYALAVWNVIWYMFFISIPFFGMSPCRNWGWCPTGTLWGVVGYFGLYRKEVRDKTVCQRCTTRDCGTSCEVGLVDMPAALARDGYFRSTKCVGAHDCEAACPYGNLYSRDVRDLVRAWLGWPDRPRIPRRQPGADEAARAGAGPAPEVLRPGPTRVVGPAPPR